VTDYSPYGERAMPVLIDGNNLLFAGRDADPERPVGRAKLCEMLGAWSRRIGEAVTVVFDGPAPSGGLAKQIGDPDIQVRFSGAGIRADDVLAEILAKDSAARRVVVVSSDREVAASARRRRARPMRSSDFWALLRDDLSRPPSTPLEPLEKRFGLGPGATD
jgi:predicted RNA-binding protein with PIN domain